MADTVADIPMPVVNARYSSTLRRRCISWAPRNPNQTCVRAILLRFSFPTTVELFSTCIHGLGRVSYVRHLEQCDV